MSKIKTLRLISFLLMLLFEIIHFITYLLIKETNLDGIFDTLELSPIYNLRIAEECGEDEYVIFHEWQGINNGTISYYDDSPKTEGKTEIDKINGYYLCYETKKSYKELLYNDQIISKNEKCKIGYKNCGIIDTLEQQLCILENDNCPLYDIGIGEENDIHKNNKDYIFHNESKIYYNNENYNETNKKIIGKLILNDGQPCYNPNKKLWKKFINIEIEDNLKCDNKIFGKSTDDRYIERGEINYYRIYQDNLKYYLSLFNDKKVEVQSNHISLYKREFIGINKECDKLSNFSEEKYDKIKYCQKKVKLFLLCEWIIVFILTIIIFLCHTENCRKAKCLEPLDSCCQFATYIYIKIPFLVFEFVFLIKIILNDLSYDCSDKITNELFKKLNINTKIALVSISINFCLDFLIIIINILLLENNQKSIKENNDSRDILNQEKNGISRTIIKENYYKEKDIKIKLNKDNNVDNNDISDNIPNKNSIILNEQNSGPLRQNIQVDNSNS